MRVLPNPFDSEWSVKPWFDRAYLLSDYNWDAAQSLFEKYLVVSPPVSKASLFPAYYLFAHSIELFFKASLSYSSGRFERSHEISTLYASFLEAYPSEKAKISEVVDGFFRMYALHDPKNENCRYPHTYGVFPDPQDVKKAYPAIKGYISDFRTRNIKS